MKYKDFEKKWIRIFMFLYVFIMIPFPFYYTTKYISGPFGVPLFIYGWIIHTIITFICIVIYRNESLKRKEYDEEFYLKDKEENYESKH